LAVACDPQGAAFSLWQRDSAEPGAAKQPGVTGTVCWNELMTTDASAARAFYGTLLGWTAEDVPLGGGYTLFRRGETMAGGMLQMTEEMKGIPPHWLVYVSVADCDDTVARATAAGGRVMVSPMTLETVGRFAILADPQGAAFAVIQLEQQA